MIYQILVILGIKIDQIDIYNCLLKDFMFLISLFIKYLI